MFCGAFIIILNNVTYQKELSKKTIMINTFIQNEVLSYDKEEKVVNDAYLGYLVIEKYNIKNLIKNGTSSDILDQNFVGFYNNGNSIDSLNGQIILAGHNNRYVFENLYKLRINDEIKIVTKEKEYSYFVKDLKIIKENDTSYFKENIEYKELILITCIKNNKYRLLVIAK